KEAKQMIDLKRKLFKIDVRAQKDEEKVFMRTACITDLYSNVNVFTALSIYCNVFKMITKVSLCLI
ncbi:hypothetical protein, partial [Streptococcus pyogenes]|uniref:hypothetical protein n=3 Tax=Streptococcus pyogenes TaxID=1314 RepID=UPI002ACDC1E1